METIPLRDIRASNPAALALQEKARALRLLDASRGAFGLASRVLAPLVLPLGDNLAKSWLTKTNNPYLAEIDAIAKALDVPGIHALNLCYEWGCTTGAYNRAGSVTLARVLDWPFPALGETVVVARQAGLAGEFLNITWPGMSGIFNALAPGRFAAAINQAPMRRHKTGLYVDWLRNRARQQQETGLPPAHLLRHVFETAKDYAEAKKMLAETPICLPVIYVLSGTEAGEGCVIERTERDAAIREMHESGVSAANHFESWLNGLGHGWMPRAIGSHARACAGAIMQGERIDDAFAWLTAPVGNALTRLAMTGDAGTGQLSVLGLDGARPVTHVYHHPASAA